MNGEGGCATGIPLGTGPNFFLSPSKQPVPTRTIMTESLSDKYFGLPAMVMADLTRSVLYLVVLTQLGSCRYRSPQVEDCVTWQYNRGIFSVRSAYRGQWKKKCGPRIFGGSSSGTSNQQIWKRLWKLQVLAKIKIFGWRVLNGLLACITILANRHIIPTGGCPVSNKCVEDIKHSMIFLCDRARAVWNSLGWQRTNGLLWTDKILLGAILASYPSVV